MSRFLLITQCLDPQRWYAGKIGEKVPYLGDTGSEFKSQEPSGYINFIQYSDASVEVMDYSEDE